MKKSTERLRRDKVAQEINKEVLNIITETASQTAAATVDKAIEKMSSFSWIERIKAISNDYFTSTEKLLYAYPALKTHIQNEDEYFAMAFHGTSGSIVKFSKYKVAKPEEEQILKDRKESYNRSKSDLEKIEKALDSIKNEKGYEIISLRYFVNKRDGNTRTWQEVAEEIGKLDKYPDNIAESTIRKYKNRLVRKIGVVLFGSDAGK